VSPGEEFFYIRERIPLSCAVLPLPPVAKVVEKTFGSIHVAATLLV
jgi:hypothetical protein